ncbi:hypothetical protein [Thermococcus aggregans]|nr:hypothetical protein [Thermococcus aggregans]
MLGAKLAGIGDVTLGKSMIAVVGGEFWPAYRMDTYHRVDTKNT